MYINNFLTEYDESLTGELNIDPLGQLVIWSAWGQGIFHRRITSIANDVRQYTLNLLHHAVMRDVMYNERLQTSGAMKKRYASKQDRNFRFACLIHLENIYIWSMLLAERQGVTLTGVLGILKARRRMESQGDHPEIRFGHESESCLLTNQIALGTNGRYKSPMMDMQFFDTHYRYDVPGSKEPWQAAESLIKKVPELRELYNAVRDYLRNLMQASHASDLSPRFDSRFDVLRKLYVKAFGHPEYVGQYSRDFWLNMTGLNRNAAGALYRVIDRERKLEPKQEYTPAQIFELAWSETDNKQDIDEDERLTLSHIIQAEPFLSLVDLMFRGLQRQSQQTLAEFRAFWQSRGLSNDSLPHMASQLQKNCALLQSLTGTPKYRFQRLLEVAAEPKLESQVAELLGYHSGIMAVRGQFSWMTLNDNVLSLQVSPFSLSGQRKNDDWVNHYYLPQFRHMLSKLWGEAS